MRRYEMEIGKPRRVHRVEPVKDPVPVPAFPEPAPPEKAPAPPKEVPAK
jgi:hypothetical protein